MYLRRRRQSLLWKLLLDDVVEGLRPFQGTNPVIELKQAVALATGGALPVVTEEIDRVLALGALVQETTPEGVRFAWTE